MTAGLERVIVQGSKPGAPTGAARPAVLVMTATLVPPPRAVARDDPAARLDDYAQALRFYLAMPREVIDRILFVDNSGSDLSPLVDLARSVPHDKVAEFLSFAGNDHPASRGKAFGEFRLLDFAVAETTIAGDDDVLWKTTGRLRFVNLPAVARAARQPYDIMCDLHNVPFVGSGRWRGNRYMDLRVWAARKRAYDAVIRGAWESAVGPFDAASLYAMMRAARDRVRVIPRFPVQPQLHGVSGRHLRDYATGRQRVKDGLRAAARRVVPWIWL